MPFIFHPTFYISAIVQHVMQALVFSSIYQISWLVKQLATRVLSEVHGSASMHFSNRDISECNV